MNSVPNSYPHNSLPYFPLKNLGMMDYHYYLNNRKLCEDLDAQGQHFLLTDDFRKWRNAWNLGISLKSTPVEKRTALIYDEFVSNYAQETLQCMIEGVPPETTKAWEIFSKGVGISLNS